MAGTTGKWVRTPGGTLVSLDWIKCLFVAEGFDGAEVRAYLTDDIEDDPYFVLFSHEDRAVCEEWRDEFARRYLDVVPPVVLMRNCPQCDGRGTLPIGPNGAAETCSFCEGERRVTLEVYESAMREWGLKP